MDTTPKQFTAVVNALKWKLGRIVNHLSNLDEDISAIRTNNEATQNQRQTNPPTLRAELHEPEAVVNQRESRENRREEREIQAAGRDRTRLIVESIAAVTALLVVALTAISVQIAKHAALTAQESAKASESQASASRAQAEAARLQTLITQQSAKATLDTFRMEQRAWIIAGAMENIPKFDITKPQPEARITVINKGKTFAVHAIIRAHLGNYPNKMTSFPPHLPEPQEKSVGILAPEIPYASRLIPSKEIANVPLRDTTPGINDTWYTYIWGEIHYQDVFGNPHFTKFCVYRQIGDAGDFFQCEIGNEIN